MVYMFGTRPTISRNWYPRLSKQRVDVGVIDNSDPIAPIVGVRVDHVRGDVSPEVFHDTPVPRSIP